MAEQEWVITVADADLYRIDEVVAELAAAGLKVERVLSALGQVTGRTELTGQAEGSTRQMLAAVDGIASVDVSRRHRLRPPDSEVQ
ncbi:hypothetical protein [Nesterenkonia ebinurensis]|uniref:hypothetical protein n=1 Tax=Nesterenkonia ebinurensis TaxID=2608252 RepID=UPI00123E0A8F|nr:hypothetical protein [Nesterenkonia ebinurensis]